MLYAAVKAASTPAVKAEALHGGGSVIICKGATISNKLPIVRTISCQLIRRLLPQSFHQRLQQDSQRLLRRRCMTLRELLSQSSP